MERLGYNSIISSLLDLGAFTGLRETPLHSVKAANFIDAITLLSMKNASI